MNNDNSQLIDDILDDEIFNKFITEEKLNEQLVLLVDAYKTELKNLENESKYLKAEQEKFPIKFVAKDNHEDNLLKASHLSHRSISYFQIAIALHGNLAEDISHIESIMKLELSEKHLRDKFDKITDSLRESYIKSNQAMRKLSKMKANFLSHTKTSEMLVRAFDRDVVDHRRFLDIKNKLMGLS